MKPTPCAILFALLLTMNGTARAADTTLARATLRGLNGVQLIIEDLDPAVEQTGLRKSSIKTDVETQLQQAGIRVLDDGDALLYVNVNVTPNGESLWGYSIDVQLIQRVILMRNNGIGGAAPTWGIGVTGAKRRENISLLRESVKHQVDRFVDAYWSVNPD